MSAYPPLIGAVLAEVGGALGGVDEAALLALERAICRASRVFVAGTGRSGLAMRGFAMRLTHLGLTAHVVGEVTTPNLAAGDLLLIGSGSGRTPSVLNWASRARALQAGLGLITASRPSPMAELADWVVEINAPTPKAGTGGQAASIQPMGTLFEQSLGICLDVLVLRLMAARGVSAEQMFARHANLE